MYSISRIIYHLNGLELSYIFIDFQRRYIPDEQTDRCIDW